MPDGPIYRAQKPNFEGASARYRGQTGRNAAITHSLTAKISFGEGDVLVTGASAPVWGYLSELERAIVIGEPAAEQRVMFDHVDPGCTRPASAGSVTPTRLP